MVGLDGSRKKGGKKGRSNETGFFLDLCQGQQKRGAEGENGGYPFEKIESYGGEGNVLGSFPPEKNQKKGG